MYWTAERLSELRPRVRQWMQETSAKRHFFGLTELATALEISHGVARGFIAEAEEEGRVIYGGAVHIGWSWKGATGQAVTLGALLRHAAECVDENAAADRGRRVTSLERLTSSQFKDIRTVSNLIARHAGYGDPEKVAGGWFGYDDQTKAWTLEQSVARWSDDEHRTNFVRKGTAGVWHPRLNTGRSKMLGAVANLLDLAATHGIIPRTATATDVKYAAPEWKPIIERWAARLLSAYPGQSTASLANGFRALTVYATRQRGLSFRATNWMAARAALEERYAALADDSNARAQDVRYARQQRDAARLVWRLVMRYLHDVLGQPSGPSGRVRLEAGNEYHWETAQDSRRSLVPDGAITGAAAAATGKTLSKEARSKMGALTRGEATSQFDYKATWTSRAGKYARSFVEGERGIAGFIMWSTAPVDWLERHNYPGRAFINPSPEMLRGIRRATGSSKKPYLLSYDTLVGRLRMISQFAGWAHENTPLVEEMVGRRYDFVAQDDLASLCNLKLVQAYSEWVREESEDDEGGWDIDVPVAVAELAKHVSKVASPYLEGRALKRADALEKAGAHEEAAQARGEAQRLREAGWELKGWGYEHSRRDNTRKDIVAIAEGWAGSNHRSGWLKLNDLVEILLKKSEAECGLTMQEQLEAIREAEGKRSRERAVLLAWQTHTWASLIRSAMLVNLVRKIPLRARALSEVRVDWFEATFEGKRVEPWHREASIMLRIPNWAMKSKEEYCAPYIRPEFVGDPDFEAGAQRGLLEVFLRSHGARTFLLTQWAKGGARRENGCLQQLAVQLTVTESAFLLPSSATFGNSDHGVPRSTRLQTGLRWNSSSLSVHFESVVREHAAELQINATALQGLQGAYRIHVARLLYGTHWAPKNLSDASLMLHHATIAITSALYVGRSSAQSALEASASELAGARQVEQQGQRIAHLQQALQAADARAVAAEQRAAEHATQLSELTAMIARLTVSLGHTTVAQE